jgi:NitT/TauT family transport system ATP-binding protein
MATRLASVPVEVAHKVHARLDGVTRIYPPRAGHGEVHALGPLSMELRAGEFFSVVGPSGCGKSTLLDVLAGLAVPSAGTVEFEGKRVLGEVPDGVGVVFQEDASFPWLSVEDNVAFGLRRAGMEAAETRRRVDFAVGFMGLNDFRRAYPSQLSGGMRVMSARPGRFIDIVDTGWPRERDSRLAERPDFGAVTARLWSYLRGESLRALGQGTAAR